MDIGEKLKELMKGYDKGTIDKIMEKMKNVINATPDGAKKALADRQKVREVMSMLSPQDQQKVANVLNNPEKLNAILNSREMEQLINKFKNK